MELLSEIQLDLTAIDYRDPVWICLAFLFGFAASRFSIPPLVGFLIAGFVLNALGAEAGQFLAEMSDLGVTLLLFTIGLKLRIKQLLRPEVWAVASVHMLGITLLGTGILLLLPSLGMPLLEQLDSKTALIIAFALSFSSTVFTVKALEGRGDTGSAYGRMAIGVLIMQDLAAVIFLAISAGKTPSAWAAILVLLLILCRPLLFLLLRRTGHGELLVLFGLVLALGGATVFEVVDLKADLGALLLGVLLAGHAKANELSRSLLSIKDLFLVGFFLNIGMAGLPQFNHMYVIWVVMAAVPIKVMLFYWLFTRFRVRARGATISAFSLGNFSEFGLIVAAVAASKGWIDSEWLIVLAVVVSLSFVISSFLNAASDPLYVRFRQGLEKLEHRLRLRGDEEIDLRDCDILVCGMGRVGTGTFASMAERYGDRVMGFDFDDQNVDRHLALGKRVAVGNVTSPEFWARIDLARIQIRYILICLPTANACLNAVRNIRQFGYRGRIAVTVKYDDERLLLLENGADETFNIYAEAGSGFASHIIREFSGEPKN